MPYIMKAQFRFIVSTVTLLGVAVFGQSVPEKLNYQGRLLNGTNLVNGSVGLSLRLYNNATGGTLFYEDSNTVIVTDGSYSTFIGDNTTAGNLRNALLQTNVFIEVVVDGTALTPREQLVGAAYAILPGVRGIGNVETGEWGTDASKAVDQGIPIDSDLVLGKSGLKDLSFRKVDHVAVDKEAGTAVAGVRVYQAEAGDEFVLEVRFVRADSGIWRASEIMNFHDFITFVAQARQTHMQEYLEDSGSIMEKHDKSIRQMEKKVKDALAAGSLGDDDTRSAIKAIMLEEIVPDWQQRKAELEELEIPTAAGTLQRLRLRIADLRIAYAQGYAAWMDDKQAGTVRAADAKLKEAHTLEHEASVLVSQVRSRMK